MYLQFYGNSITHHQGSVQSIPSPQSCLYRVITLNISFSPDQVTLQYRVYNVALNSSLILVLLNMTNFVLVLLIIEFNTK